MTPRQADLLAFIHSYMAKRPGVPPSYKEMGNAIGLKSTSGVNRLVVGLVDRGHLIRTAKYRGLSLPNVIQNCPNCGYHLQRIAA